MTLVEKGLEVSAKIAEKNPLVKFAKETVLRDQTMKETLVAKFKFLKEDLLGPKRSKFEASSKTQMNDFLRRMIVENPEEIVHSYAEHLLSFGSDATQEDFTQFSGELGFMKSSVVRILGVIKKDPKTLKYIQPMEQFLGYLDLMIVTADGFAAMPDKDRKKALSGDKDGLSDGQKFVLQQKMEVELLKKKVFKKAQLKEDRMKATDSDIMQVLDDLYEKEMARERANKGDGENTKKGKGEEGHASKESKSPKKKSAQNKHSKGGQAKSKKESFIEESSEAA